MIYTYDLLALRIASTTHRSDLSTLIPSFVDDANEKINRRLTLDLVTPDTDNQGAGNDILFHQPLLYLYAALVSAYEYINEVDMAMLYYERWLQEIELYHITSVQGVTPSYVMGEGATPSQDSDTPTPTPSTGWILETGYWNDQGEWVDAAQWND